LDILFKALQGAASGAAVAFIGYAKAFTPEGAHEPLKVKKAIKTVIMGTVVGGISGATGLDAGSVEANIGSYGLVTYLIDSAVSFLSKKYFSKVEPSVDSLKIA
jgi:hypothetical protein